MQSVDTHDQLNGSDTHTSYHWWMAVSGYIFNTAVSNAYLLSKDIPNLQDQVRSRREFKASVAKGLIQRGMRYSIEHGDYTPFPKYTSGEPNIPYDNKWLNLGIPRPEGSVPRTPKATPRSTSKVVTPKSTLSTPTTPISAPAKKSKAPSPHSGRKKSRSCAGAAAGKSLPPLPPHVHDFQSIRRPGNTRCITCNDEPKKRIYIYIYIDDVNFFFFKKY